MPAPKRILITGANGFAGFWLVRHLDPYVRAGDVTLLCAGRGEDAPIRLDLTDEAGLIAIIADAQPDAVIHLAALASPAVAAQDPLRAWQVNATGTLALARAVLAQAPEARFVFAGSAEAYGRSFNRRGGMADEDERLDPVTVYGASKAAADIAVGQLCEEGLKAFRFRPFNHTGPGQGSLYAIPSFARQIAEAEQGLREPVIEVGNLAVERDFVDVRDIVAAYATAALSDFVDHDACIFNLASGHAVSLGDVLATLVGAAHCPLEIRVTADRMRRADIPRMTARPARAGMILGWQPRIPLSTTLSDVLAYWRERVASESVSVL